MTSAAAIASNLVFETDEGIRVSALHPRRREDRNLPWRSRPDWTVSQRLDHPDPEAAGRQALLDLEGGADGLALVFAGGPAARGHGLPASLDALRLVLHGVELDFIGTRLDAGRQTLLAASALCELVGDRRLGSANVDVDFGYDPISIEWYGASEHDPETLARLLDLSHRAGLAGHLMLADGRTWHEAGAGEARELALVIAAVVEHLRALEGIGLSLEDARAAIAVLLPFDADLYLGIAKARAMRMLWRMVETASGLTPAPLRIHAETSWRMMTRFDPWTNAMRTTSATTAAALGGADTITVLPMTLAGCLPDEDTRRLARNTGRILIDEAHLDAVDDPGAGAGAIETLTDELCRQAWSTFQDVERCGGLRAVLRDGTLRCSLAEAANRRKEGVRTLTRGIVGTSLYPGPTPPGSHSTTVGTSHHTRDAVPFEALRDDAAAVTRRRPVFVATLGPPAAFGPRANFATNLLAAAGLETVVSAPGRFATEGFAVSGANVACLCGSDAAYDLEGAEVIATLRAAGAVRISMVGEDEKWKDVGIDSLLRRGADMLEALSMIQRASISPRRDD